MKGLAQAVEEQLLVHREDARARGVRVPGTAEYLDAIAALDSLGIRDVGSEAWKQVERCIFDKDAALRNA